MKLRAIVVDDEPLAIKLMCNLLASSASIDVIKTCKNGREAIQACEEFRPDVLFLDIQMPGLTGLDVAARLQSDVIPLIVFVTAYDEYALNAFELNAVDYLLKPVDAERLTNTLDRLQSRFQRIDVNTNKTKTDIISAISQIGSRHSLNKLHARKLAIKDGSEIHLVPFDDIKWVDAAGDYMCVHSGDETHIMRITMKELESKLSAPNFVRIHRSTIVNTQTIQAITTLPKGEAELTLTCGAKLKVSRSYRTDVQSSLSLSILS